MTMKEKIYRVGNPMEVPSNVHVLRFKEPDYMRGDILVQGEEEFMYEDDLIFAPPCLRVADLQDWINRGFLVERDDG